MTDDILDACGFVDRVKMTYPLSACNPDYPYPEHEESCDDWLVVHRTGVFARLFQEPAPTPPGRAQRYLAVLRIIPVLECHQNTNFFQIHHRVASTAQGLAQATADLSQKLDECSSRPNHQMRTVVRDGRDGGYFKSIDKQDLRYGSTYLRYLGVQYRVPVKRLCQVLGMGPTAPDIWRRVQPFNATPLGVLREMRQKTVMHVLLDRRVTCADLDEAWGPGRSLIISAAGVSVREGENVALKYHSIIATWAPSVPRKLCFMDLKEELVVDPRSRLVQSNTITMHWILEDEVQELLTCFNPTKHLVATLGVGQMEARAQLYCEKIVAPVLSQPSPFAHIVAIISPPSDLHYRPRLDFIKHRLRLHAGVRGSESRFMGPRDVADQCFEAWAQSLGGDDDGHIMYPNNAQLKHPGMPKDSLGRLKYNKTFLSTADVHFGDAPIQFAALVDTTDNVG